MRTWFKRAGVALLLALACQTATSGATYTATSANAQGFSAAADFGVHVSLQTINSPLRGLVDIDVNATETAGGTITQVVVQRTPAGANTWTTICTDFAPTPWRCTLDTTTLSNGQLYDFRAVATNNNAYSRTSVIVANRLVDNAPPTAPFTGPADWSRGTISLTSTATDTGGSGMANVRYEYQQSPSGAWSTACTGTVPSDFACSFDTNAMTNGTNYDFRAVATDGAGNSTTSTEVTNRRADNAPPNVATVADPGTNRRGVVALAGTAGDAHSGVASARIEYSVAGANSWSTACIDATTPFTACDWDTTLLDGLFDLRAVVTDVTGNTLTSATVANRRIDNTAPTSALNNLASPLSATVTFTFSASDGTGSGVNSGKVQYTLAGGSTWTDACTDASAPYSTCARNTTTMPDALYDFRSALTDVAGNPGYSPVVASRRVDNFVPSAVDVQTANGGATVGVIEVGDTMTLTYSEEIDPTSLIAGWNGTGSQNIYAQINHHNQGDRVLFYSRTDPYPLIPLAVSPGVNLDEDYIPNSGAVWIEATLARSGNSFVVTLGTVVAGSVQTVAPPAGTMNWFPNSAARDYLGKATSTAQRGETGASDREF